MSQGQLGDIPPGAPVPTNVTGELDLTQGFGPLDNGSYLTRGYSMTPSGVPFFSNASQVRHHIRSRALTAECMLRPVYAAFTSSIRLCISKSQPHHKRPKAWPQRGSPNHSCITLPEGEAERNMAAVLSHMAA